MIHDESGKSMCSVKGCNSKAIDENGFIYGPCDKCEVFLMCGKDDEAHEAALLYSESCRSHHDGGYSVCLGCAVEAYKEYINSLGRANIVGEERCIYPVCKYDFGLFTDLKN